MNRDDNNPLFIAFATQKGGVGKSAFSVLMASMLHYKMGYNVVVVDCDYPQGSIYQMRNRDLQIIEDVALYKEMFYKQLTTIQKPAYTILSAPAESAIDVANAYLASSEDKVDIVIFDLPGTIKTEGVLECIANLDYLFTPIAADKMVLDSSLSFAMTVNQLIVDNPSYAVKGMYLFWNKVDARARTDIYDVYESSMEELGLKTLRTRLPNSIRFDKELHNSGKPFFRSTLFPIHHRLLGGSCFLEFTNEVIELIKPARDEC